MKSRIVYIFLSVMICLIIIIGFRSFGEKEYIRQGKADISDFSVWNSTKAKGINNTLITINIDGTQLKNDYKAFYMSDTLTLMLPVNLVAEAFDCAVNLYNDNTLVIEKGTSSLKLMKNSLSMIKNGEEINIEHTFEVIDNTLYVPVDALKVGLNYDYSWDALLNMAVLTSINRESSLPYYYNYKDNGRAPLVKDQGKLGTCWAFASLTALESSLLPEEILEFSPDHMSLNNSYNISQNTGGDYTMSISYLASWMGPVLESQDTYGDGKTTSGLKSVKHLQEVQLIKSKDYESIKKMVYKYGGVQSSLFTSMVNTQSSGSFYYNQANNAYCYIGTQKPNHDVVIIGWDDNYPKENFNADLEGDGAFICRNSWGSDFGDNGNFYVSYYDSVIGVHNLVYTRVDNPNNYNNIYQSDLCGWVGQLGYGKEMAYFANVYTSKELEDLKAVSFYATGRDTEYSVYVCENFEDTSSLNILKEPNATGMLSNSGYYTIDLKNPVRLKPGQKYAIIIKIYTPNSTRPIAIEYQNDEKTSVVDLTDGEGYISLRGFDWESTEEKHGCNLCLKAFTNSVKMLN